jgi:hypothetical protein
MLLNMLVGSCVCVLWGVIWVAWTVEKRSFTKRVAYRRAHYMSRMWMEKKGYWS